MALRLACYRALDCLTLPRYHGESAMMGVEPIKQPILLHGNPQSTRKEAIYTNLIASKKDYEESTVLIASAMTDSMVTFSIFGERVVSSSVISVI